jgi:hypothetical protein
MNDISDRGLACLWEVVRGPGGLPGRPGEAWTERRRLTWLFGADLVTELMIAGWLADWPELSAVTLSPLAASVLKVRIEERPGDEIEVWVSATDPERPYRLPRHQERLPCLDHLPDPRPRPRAYEGAPRLAGGLGRRVEYLRARARRGDRRSLAG